MFQQKKTFNLNLPKPLDSLSSLEKIPGIKSKLNDIMTQKHLEDILINVLFAQASWYYDPKDTK